MVIQFFMFTEIFSGNNYDYFEMTAYIHVMLRICSPGISMNFFAVTKIFMSLW